MSLSSIALLFLMFQVNPAANSASLKGRTVDRNGDPIAQAQVLILETAQTQWTNEKGLFFFQLSPGEYSVQIKAKGFTQAQPTKVNIQKGKSLSITVQLETLLREEMTLTVTGSSKALAETSQTVDVISSDQLARLREPSLGETLAKKPAISSTAFGTAASRPIIRGLSGDRIRVLEDELGTGDVSTTSVDHAISVDLAGLDHIEVLRGPATLRYGSNAIGGVVNVLDQRIPAAAIDNQLHGNFKLEGDTVANRRSSHLQLRQSQGRWAWQANATSNQSDDYEVPGANERFEAEEPMPGQQILTNSSMDMEQLGAGIAYNYDRGRVGFAFKDFTNRYGLPGHEHHHHEEEGHDDHGHKNDDHDDHDHGDEHEHDESVFLDMQQKRFEMLAEHNTDATAFRKVTFKLAGTDYEHVEAEGDNLGTLFENDYLEGRLELATGKLGWFDEGNIGLHYTDRDFSALGEEAFVQPNTMERFGAFVYQEKSFSNWNLNMGARYEQQENDGSVVPAEHGHDDHDHDDDHHDHAEKFNEDDVAEEVFYNRSFNSFSAAVGTVIGTTSDYSVALNATFTERAPTAESLFASGLHLATSSFEIGDPNLRQEQSTGLEVLFRKKAGIVQAEVAVFYSDYEDFIYEQFTGEEIDGLPVLEFTQADSEHYGGEAQLKALLYEGQNQTLDLVMNYDLVRASLKNGSNLPRITPDRLAAELLWQNQASYVSAYVRHVDDQNRVAAFETATDAFTLLNFSVGTRFKFGGLSHHLGVRFQNITDEEIRYHTSFLKDRILQPGRNLAISYSLNF